MKRILLAGAAIAAYVTPVFADEKKDEKKWDVAAPPLASTFLSTSSAAVNAWAAAPASNSARPRAARWSVCMRVPRQVVLAKVAGFYAERRERKAQGRAVPAHSAVRPRCGTVPALTDGYPAHGTPGLSQSSFPPPLCQMTQGTDAYAARGS